jgi:hypothetical protein
MPEQDDKPIESPPPAPDAIEAARLTLIQAGYPVLDNDALARRLAAERKKLEPRAIEADTLRLERDEARAELAKHANAGKSESQIWTERQAEWQRQQAESAKRVAELEGANRSTEERARAAARDRRLSDLLDGAIDPELARTACLLKVPNVSADLDGKLTVVDAAGIEHTGREAESIIKAWWDVGGTFLRRAPAPGPRGGDATRPPNQNPQPYQYGQQGVDLQDRLLRAERANQAARRKG